MTRTTAASLAPSAYQDGFARANLPPAQWWPELAFTLPELQYPARLNCAAVLLEHAHARVARVALMGEGVRWTYAELNRQVDRIAHVLRTDLGLATGQRVLLRGANTPMLAAAMLAVFKAGLIAVPTMPLLRARELAVIIEKAKVDAVLCAFELREEIEALPAPPRHVRWLDSLGGADRPFEAVDTAADDICLISFTSGTTGVPKGTMHFHRDLLAICDTFARHVLHSRADDIFIGTPPLAFTFGLGGLLLFPLRVGAAAVLLPQLSADTLLPAIARYRATVTFTAPTCYRQMAPLAAQHDLSSLSRCVSAGEMLPRQVRAAWEEATGITMIDGIGSTEMLHIFIASAGDAVRAGAVGKPVPGFQACVLDAQGRPVGPGIIGRLAVKGPTGCRYLADARQQDVIIDGWSLTGDAFEMDADGYFHYRARADEMIVSSGYNIAGVEVEDALLRHPAVAECAVIGRADEARGQLVEAHVVLAPEVLAGETSASEILQRQLQDFVKAHIAPYKYPRRIVFVDQLPRTENGKLQRFKLR